LVGLVEFGLTYYMYWVDI